MSVNTIKDYTLLFMIIIIIIIIGVTLNKKINLSIRNTLLVILVYFLFITVPSTDMIHAIYYQLFLSTLVIVTIITIFLLPVSIRVRCGITIIIISMYYKNLYILLTIITKAIEIINTSKNVKRPDAKLSKEVTSAYSNIGMRIVTNFTKLPNHPTMILANYCKDRCENPMCIILPRNLSIIMQEGFKRVNMSGIIHHPIYVKGHGQGNFEYIKKEVRKTVKHGNDVFAYINNPSYFGYIGKIRSGMFRIAIELGISITPVCFDFIDTKLGVIPNQNYCVKIGETIYDKNLTEAIHRVRKFYINTLAEFKTNKYNPYFFLE